MSNSRRDPPNFGKQKDPWSAFSYDASDLYANAKELYIEFEYVFALPEEKRVRFKAFITEYSDSFNSNWNPDEVYGRPDPIYTYQGTTRSITLAWAVPSASVTEARENLAKASKMMRYLYPTYSTAGDASTISKPPLLRMRFVNLAKKNEFTGLLGKVNGFTFDPDMEEGWFDADHSNQPIAGNQTRGNVNLLYPKLLNFSCTFDVIHEHHLGWQDGKWEIATLDKTGEMNSPEYDKDTSAFPFVPYLRSANSILGTLAEPYIIESPDTEISRILTSDEFIQSQGDYESQTWSDEAKAEQATQNPSTDSATTEILESIYEPSSEEEAEMESILDPQGD